MSMKSRQRTIEKSKRLDLKDRAVRACEISLQKSVKSCYVSNLSVFHLDASEKTQHFYIKNNIEGYLFFLAIAE